MEELGTCDALIYKVSTLVDGGCRLTLDLNSKDIELIQKLLKLSMTGDPLVTIGFVRGE